MGLGPDISGARKSTSNNSSCDEKEEVRELQICKPLPIEPQTIFFLIEMRSRFLK